MVYVIFFSFKTNFIFIPLQFLFCFVFVLFFCFVFVLFLVRVWQGLVVLFCMLSLPHQTQKCRLIKTSLRQKKKKKKKVTLFDNVLLSVFSLGNSLHHFLLQQWGNPFRAQKERCSYILKQACFKLFWWRRVLYFINDKYFFKHHMK